MGTPSPWEADSIDFMHTQLTRRDATTLCRPFNDQTWLPGNTVYGASKWAMRGLAKTLAEELKDQSIRVTHVSLGAVYTEIWHGRAGFNKDDMLAVEEAAQSLAHVALLPLRVRVDEMDLTPGKGTL